MSNHLRRYAIGALAVGVVAGASALGFAGAGAATGAATWQPVTYNLTATPAQLLPANVSSEHPVRIVSTALNRAGQPVVSAGTATSAGAAAKLIEDGKSATNAVGVELDEVATATGVGTATDPYRSQQWDLGKMRAGDAWQKSTGAGVTVAVIDTGVDASHPDLAGHVLPGIDLVSHTDGTSTDPNGHGTHVSGTIAALTGNGTGVASFAPDAKILPVRVLAANGSGYMSDAATGIIWAADHGANVINMSLGAPGQLTAVSNAISYARSKGVTVVAAAGNERAKGSPTSYPAADAGVIAVAATDSSDNVASYSNAGSYVDVAAPGSGIISTIPVAKGSYGNYNGTSMAAPHVAAVAALIKAYNPALTPDGIQKALESSAVDLGTRGRDNDFGYGRIDALAALNAAAPAPTSPTKAPTTTTPITTAPITTAPITTAPTTAPTTKAPEPTRTATTAPSTLPTTKAPEPAKTPATTTPTPSPTKVTTAPKTTPGIRAVVPSTTVGYGGTAIVSYTITVAGRPWAGKPARIVALQNGAVTLTDTTTDPNGNVLFAKLATGPLQVKLVVVGTDTTNEVSSPVISFAIRAQVAASSPAQGALHITLAGAAGQTVQVQRYDGGRWIIAKTYPAAASHTMTDLRSGSQYRVVVSSISTVGGVVSGIIKIA